MTISTFRGREIMTNDVEKIKAENDKLKEIGKGKNLNAKGFIVAETCAACRFGLKIEDTMICRYNPPVIEGYPKVNEQDWCGKYEYDGMLR